jgi:hypothetical protein
MKSVKLFCFIINSIKNISKHKNYKDEILRKKNTGKAEMLKIGKFADYNIL